MNSRPRVLLTLPVTLWTPAAVTLLVDAGCDGIRMIAKEISAHDFRSAVDMVIETSLRSPRRRPFQIVVDLPGNRPRFAGELWSRPVREGDVVQLAPATMLEAREPVRGIFPVIGLDDVIIEALRPEDRIVMGDGEVTLQIVDVADAVVVTRCVAASSDLRATRSLSLPDCPGAYSPFTNTDLRFVEALGDVQGLHAYLSMVSDPDDVTRFRQLTDDRFVALGAKIETQLGVDAVESVAAVADRIVVGRGDLGVELAPHDVVGATLTVIDRSLGQGTAVTLASSILTSLLESSQPSVPDVLDIVHHCQLGVDEFLLSGAICYKEPWRAVRWARKILVGAAECSETAGVP